MSYLVQQLAVASLTMSAVPVILSAARAKVRAKSICPGLPWKDPENPSLAKLRQGILTKYLVFAFQLPNYPITQLPNPLGGAI